MDINLIELLIIMFSFAGIGFIYGFLFSDDKRR